MDTLSGEIPELVKPLSIPSLTPGGTTQPAGCSRSESVAGSPHKAGYGGYAGC